MVAGMFGGLGRGVIEGPFEYVKVRRQVKQQNTQKHLKLSLLFVFSSIPPPLSSLHIENSPSFPFSLFFSSLPPSLLSLPLFSPLFSSLPSSLLFLLLFSPFFSSPSLSSPPFFSSLPSSLFSLLSSPPSSLLSLPLFSLLLSSLFSRLIVSGI